MANRSVFRLRQLTHFSGNILSRDWDNCPGWEVGRLELEAVILGQDYRLSAGINAKFGKNIGDVVAHGLLANKERLGNMAVFMAQCQMPTRTSGGPLPELAQAMRISSVDRAQPDFLVHRVSMAK